MGVGSLIIGAPSTLTSRIFVVKKWVGGLALGKVLPFVLTPGLISCFAVSLSYQLGSKIWRLACSLNVGLDDIDVWTSL
jgi:hypothetical protein